jgi:adenylosuccinate synthase
MTLDILLGLQWGDEGKGKIVDVLSTQYNVIARFQGGPNAGHSLEFNGIKHVLHTIPSGIFRPETINVVGNGVVIDPVVFKKETDALVNMGVNVYKNLLISKKAHLIIPSHRLLDAASEQSKGLSKIGSTLKGIGPTYMDKTGRNGLRIGDLSCDDFLEKYQKLVEKHKAMLSHFDFEYDLASLEDAFFIGVENLKKFAHIDSEHCMNSYLIDGKRILAEGAQGSLLDIDFGSYPFVTSSNTISAGACTGLGVAPNKIGDVFGIFKAYCTRVGSGPFPTELNDATGEKIRAIGREFGATTGRPRRCGWLDLPALKYSCMLNGVTQLIMTKADVLSGFDELQVCTHYLHRGEKIDYLPYDIDEKYVSPVYQTVKGWDEDLTGVRDSEDLPANLQEYILFIEDALQLPVTWISVGPDREQTMERVSQVSA